MRALVSELKIMIHLGRHLNVVNLLGAVTKDITKCNEIIFELSKNLSLNIMMKIFFFFIIHLPFYGQLI